MHGVQLATARLGDNNRGCVFCLAGAVVVVAGRVVDAILRVVVMRDEEGVGLHRVSICTLHA